MSEEIGFIKKINDIYEKLDAIEEASQLFDDDVVDKLEELAGLNVQEIVDDLKKGNYLGKRKLDINLDLNNQNEDEECTYKSATLGLNTGTNVKIDFTTTTDEGDTVVEEISSYTALYTKILEGISDYNLSESDAQLRITNYELDVINQTLADTPTLLRLRDADGTACNIDTISLEYYNGGNPITTSPSYSWIDTTSSLEVLSNIVPSLLELGNNIKDFSVLADKEEEMQYLYDNRDVTENVNEALDNLTILSDNITEILNARTYAEQTETYANQISSLNPNVVYLANGETASVNYNPSTGDFTIFMPQGQKGDTGEPFTIGAMGNTAGKSAYDGATKDFTYLDTTTGNIFFKLSNTVADWSIGFSFLGEQGEDGVGISSVNVIDDNGVSKIRFTKTDATTNDIILSKALIGLENVNNTSDANKPVSIATTTELNKKVNTTDIKNVLTSTDINKPLSAYQGKVLKDLITSIQGVLLSDTSTLDSFQELVDYIEQNRTSLQSLAVSNISGLSTSLNNKANVDLSNVSSLPTSVISQLKGDTGATGATGAVGATFSVSGSTLYITTN